jgi:hypothetical protein
LRSPAANVNEMRAKPVLLGTLGLVVLAACSTTTPDTSSKRPPEPYARVVTVKSNLLQFQVAARKFLRNGRSGPAVWLTGVSHVGQTNYFTAVQEFLASKTLVLFEGVADRSKGSGGPATAPDAETATAPKPGRDQTGLQADLASAMGLRFQLDAIDYRRPNFRNSDLSVQELREILAQQPVESGEGSAARSFDSLLELMQGDTPFYFLANIALRFVRASPKLQAFAKIALIETVGQIGGDPTQLRGLPANLQTVVQVLIERRDQKVVADLRTELQQAGRRDSLAIFYGAGHMADLEMRLRSELKYQPVNEVWFTAIEVDLATAGIVDSDLQMIRSMIKGQMNVPLNNTNRHSIN